MTDNIMDRCSNDIEEAVWDAGQDIAEAVERLVNKLSGTGASASEDFDASWVNDRITDAIEWGLGDASVKIAIRRATRPMEGSRG